MSDWVIVITIEFDVFEGKFAGLMLAEVEFSDETSANAFQAPEWFGEDVTYDRRYHNSNLSKGLF